jgi:hypothetical protein
MDSPHINFYLTRRGVSSIHNRRAGMAVSQAVMQFARPIPAFAHDAAVSLFPL